MSSRNSRGIAVLLFGLAVGAAPAFAQSSGAPARGKLLFEDTAATSGVSTLGSCTNCHVSIDNIRASVAGSTTASPPITFETALNRFGASLGRPQMQQFTALTATDRGDIAAYIADTPTVSAETLSFSAAAINTTTASQTITVTSPQASLGTLVVSKIEIGGTGLADFGRTFECDTKSFDTPASTCAFSVYYSPKNATASNAVVTITMKEGSGPDILRRVTLSGSVGAAPTTSPDTTASNVGGGAVGWAWGAGLIAMIMALGLRRRH